MGIAEYTTKVIANVNLNNALETVVAQLPSVSNYGAGNRVHLRGWANVIPGTSTTALVWRVRRGVDATGVVVGNASNDSSGFTVGASADWTIEAEENPAEIAGQSYVLTCAQTGGAANGTVNSVEFTATVG